MTKNSSAPEVTSVPLVEPASRTFGKILRKIRQSKGLTQAECANSCGLGHRHFQKIEAGQVNPPLEFFRSIGKTLDTKTCYFFNEDALKGPMSEQGHFCLVELLDLFPVSAFVLSSDGELLYSNSEFSSIFGDKNRSFWSLCSYPEDSDGLRRQVENLSNESKKFPPSIIRVTARDQRVYPAKLDWRAFERKGGSRPEILGTISLLQWNIATADNDKVKFSSGLI